MSIRDWIGLVLAMLVVISAIPYAAFRGVRKAMRRRSRKNMGTAAGFDAGVVGATAVCLGLIAEFSAQLLSATGLTANLLNVAFLIGTLVSLAFFVLMVTAYVYGRPSWVIPEKEDLWIRESDDRKPHIRNRRQIGQGGISVTAKRKPAPVLETGWVLEELDRRLASGQLSPEEHDEWQSRLGRLQRADRSLLAWPITIGLTTGLILIAVVVIILVQ